MLHSNFPALLRRRIQHDGMKRDCLPPLIANNGNVGVKPSELAISANNTMDLIVSVASAKQLTPEGLGFFKIIRMDESHPTGSPKFLKGAARVFCRFPVHVNKRSARLSLP
jgi:hypothetical protein